MGRSSWPRWRTSAPAARAMSARSLTANRAPWRSAASRSTAAASSSGPASACLSRSWIRSTPAPRTASANSPRSGRIGVHTYSREAASRSRRPSPARTRPAQPSPAGGLAGLALGFAGPLGGAVREVGDALGGGGGLGVEAAGDAAGAVGEAAGLDGLAHGLGHQGRLLGAGDGAGQQDGVAAELHGHGGVRGGADPGVQDHRDGRLLDDDAQVVGVGDAHAGADGRPQRHDRGAAQLGQVAGQDRVVVGVGQHGEAVVDQGLGGVAELDRVREQGPVVADDLELDPVGVEGLPGQLGRAHGVAGGEAAGGVGQQPAPDPPQDVQDRAPGLGAGPPQGDGGHLGPGGGQGLLQRLQAGRPAGPHDQPGGERLAGDHEGSSISSSSLGGAEHLEAVVVVEGGGGPGAAGDDLAVEGDGDARPAGRVAEAGPAARPRSGRGPPRPAGR